MTVIDLFCGAGGFSMGFLQASPKFKITHAIDYWKGCKETYEQNHPDTEFILASIHDLDPRDFKDVDVVIGSPPCPDFSRAKRDADPRRGMILVSQYREWIRVIKPKWWIMENVPSVINYLDRSYPKKKVLNCANFGVAQDRERCFAGKYVTPQQTHIERLPQGLIQTTLFDDINSLKKWRTVRQVIGDLLPLIDVDTNKAKEGVIIPNLEGTVSSQESMKRKLYECEFGMQKRYRNFDLDKPSCTISDMHGDQPIILQDGKLRRLTVREVARIQGFPDDFVFHGSRSDCYTMVGNSVPPPMARHLALAILQVEA